MTDRDRRRPWRRILMAAALIPAIAMLVAACGGDDDEDDRVAEGEPIRVGFLSTCEGAFGAFYEPTAGGFNMPLINRGAEAVSQTPTDGIEGGEIAGRPVEIAGYGCSDETPDVAVAEARRLVEQQDAEILIGPLSGDEGIAIANYAAEQPDVTFINGASGAQDTTLKVQSPNFFRFHTDGAQWSAGVGDYAYNELGWRTAATIGDDYSFPYTSVGGFIADFCAVGGDVVERIWPPLGESDYSSFIAQIPDDVDGIYVGVGGEGLISFMEQFIQQRGPVDPDEMIGNLFVDDPLVLEEIGNRVVGVTTSGNTAGDSDDPDVEEYVAQIDAVYPEVAELAASVFVYHYYTAAEAMATAIEELDGDISDKEEFHETLANLELSGVDAAYGDIRLDENRQAVSDNYIKHVVETDDGEIAVETIARVPDVDQQFGGAFTEDTPAPDRNNPTCEERDLPWAGQIEEVDFGG